MEKVDLSKGCWNPQRKLGVAFIFFEIICLESLTTDVSIFLKEKDKIFLHRFSWSSPLHAKN